jgi:hypothetical protein
MGVTARSARLPLLPARGILPAVNAEHDDDVAFDTRVDGVGESREDRSPRLVVCLWKGQGVAGDPPDEHVHGLAELHSEAGAP